VSAWFWAGPATFRSTNAVPDLPRFGKRCVGPKAVGWGNCRGTAAQDATGRYCGAEEGHKMWSAGPRVENAGRMTSWAATKIKA